MRNGRKKLRTICGARNRRGEPCQRKLLLKGKKCPNHGGKSTGPKTEAGKARCRRAALLNLKRTPNWRKRAAAPCEGQEVDREPMEQESHED